MPLILGANSLTGGYEVDNSLRFNRGSSDGLSKNIWYKQQQENFTISSIGLKDPYFWFW
jgi:hypothetical protein